MNGYALGALLSGIAAVLALGISIWRGQHQDRATKKEAAQEHRRDLQAFVATQTETLLKGYQGVFDEYQRQARDLIQQLHAITAERDGLVLRVSALEKEVSELKGRIAGMEASGGR